MDQCNELLENIQQSLHYCCSNTQKYKFTNTNNKQVYPLRCENIVNYEKKIENNKNKAKMFKPNDKY